MGEFSKIWFSMEQEKRQQTIVLTPKSGEHDPPRMLMLKPWKGRAPQFEVASFPATAATSTSNENHDKSIETHQKLKFDWSLDILSIPCQPQAMPCFFAPREAKDQDHRHQDARYPHEGGAQQLLTLTKLYATWSCVDVVKIYFNTNIYIVFP